MALAIFLATGVTMQAQDRLTQYKVRNAISVRTPIMNDSINLKEKNTPKRCYSRPGRTTFAGCTDAVAHCGHSGVSQLREKQIKTINFIWLRLRFVQNVS